MIESLETTSLSDGAHPVPTEGVPVEFVGGGGHRLHSGNQLTYKEARQSPCLSCTTSPCCNYLVLTDFKLETVLDIDYAVYLLNFDGILIGLGRQGKAEVYFHQPCHYLDVASGLCTVHSTPLQPSVCVHYNAHTCAYRSRMLAEVDPDRPLVDRRRMAWFAEQATFDDDRQLATVPEWEDVLEAFRTMPLQREPAPAPKPDPVIEEWRSIVLSKKKPEANEPQMYHFGHPQVSEPCEGCEAWCCKMLVFNRGLPVSASQVEYMRYCLGFPGIEVGVAEDGWAVIVHTTCRHLQGNRCSVFGTDDRPLKCDYYEALNCSYRGHFGVPRPEDIVRVRRDQFGVLAESMVFDELGKTLAIPPIDILRDRLEQFEVAREEWQSSQPVLADHLNHHQS
jgi:hypothetical protein